MMKLLPTVLPLFGFTFLASCSNSGVQRDPETLVGRSRAEILAEFGKPVRTSKYTGHGAEKVSDDSFRVDNTWRLSEPKPESVFEKTNRYSANATETLFLPITLGAKARDAAAGRELSVYYRADQRQTVKVAYVQQR